MGTLSYQEFATIFILLSAYSTLQSINLNKIKEGLVKFCEKNVNLIMPQFPKLVAFILQLHSIYLSVCRNYFEI